MKPTITFLNKKENQKKNSSGKCLPLINANNKYNYIIHDAWTNVQGMILASQPYPPKYNFNLIQIYNC